MLTSIDRPWMASPLEALASELACEIRDEADDIDTMESVGAEVARRVDSADLERFALEDIIVATYRAVREQEAW